MPAYIQHHTAENTAIFCPSCLGFLPMFVRDVEPHWSMAKIDFIYECSDCGGEVLGPPAPRRGAERVLAAFDASATGVVQIDGVMLDAPHHAQARRIMTSFDRG